MLSRYFKINEKIGLFPNVSIFFIREANNWLVSAFLKWSVTTSHAWRHWYTQMSHSHTKKVMKESHKSLKERQSCSTTAAIHNSPCSLMMSDVQSFECQSCSKVTLNRQNTPFKIANIVVCTHVHEDMWAGHFRVFKDAAPYRSCCLPHIHLKDVKEEKGERIKEWGKTGV